MNRKFAVNYRWVADYESKFETFTIYAKFRCSSRFLRKFKPTKILGQGAFGCVFEVEEIFMQKKMWKFAVKRIPLPMR